ncbi:hypothetical protein [Halarchaeum salinum]|uniref:hypothetical protein n=1 Tax=Halarchaeum salinum TaxID=489912 RepID=UPI001B85C8E6
MPIEKEELEKAVQSTSPIDNSGSYAEDFIVYAVGAILIASLIVGFLTLVAGIVGSIIGIFANLVIAYFIVSKLFEKVNSMVDSKMHRRERQIIEAIESD